MWTDVVKEVSGEKVIQDPKRLKKAIKRREKAKEKSATAWKVY